MLPPPANKGALAAFGGIPDEGAADPDDGDVTVHPWPNRVGPLVVEAGVDPNGLQMDG
jgi:hypothetical protein